MEMFNVMDWPRGIDHKRSHIRVRLSPAKNKTKLRSRYERNERVTFPLLTSLRSFGAAGKLSRSNAAPTTKRDALATSAPRFIEEGERFRNKRNSPMPFFGRRLFPALPSSSSLRSPGASSRIFGTLAKSNGSISSAGVDSDVS